MTFSPHPLTRPSNEPVRYIRNKDLLAEIHRSKCSFCSFLAPEYSRHDLIVGDVSAILDSIDAAKAKRASFLSTKEAKVLPASISQDDLVFRVMTGEHIPDDPNRKRRGKGPNEMQARTNFPPFKHYIIKDGVPFEVGRSHWKGGLQNGEFCIDHGRIGNRLAQMFMLLVERYSGRANWRGYSYVDEMRNHALLQLTMIGLQFDEFKSDNPFAFYTTVVRNCFTRVLNLEKRGQHIRDDLLMMHGAAPSFSRQIDHEMEQAKAAETPVPAAQTESEGVETTIIVPVKVPAKRGRKPGVKKAPVLT